MITAAMSHRHRRWIVTSATQQKFPDPAWQSR
jgi:hypothetical protein